MAHNYYEDAYAKEDLSKCVDNEEPKVVLTVDEAFSLRGVFVSLSFSRQSKENKELLGKAIRFLDKRIEQAEGK